MRFSVLDGWRGLCALLVALHHFHGDNHLFALPLVRNGYLFVDFFFVLSGFVLAHSWSKRLARPGEVGRFIARRLGRLWPLHAAVLLAFVVLEGVKAVAAARLPVTPEHAPFSGETSWPALVSNLALVHALGLHDRPTWNFPSWSISTEFATCLLFAVVCRLGWAPHPMALAGLAGLGAAVVAWASPEWLHTLTDYGVFRCIYGFFLGCLVHRLLAAHLGRPLPRATLLEVAAITAAAALVTVSPKGSPQSMLAPLVFAAAVAVFSLEGGALSRLLAGGWAQRLGAWSYSIYLVHSLLLMMLGRAVNAVQSLTGMTLTRPWQVNGETRVLLSLGGPWIGDAVALLYLAAVIAVAALTFRWIEEPARRWSHARVASAKASS